MTCCGRSFTPLGASIWSSPCWPASYWRGWAYQLNHGIGVAGIRWPVFWGFYITNFVFWIGISHAGTLISAILRISNATWRRPVTRCAGGVVGGTFGLWLTATAQTLWPLQTGGMPIVTMWTNAIIIYELTMLGAILATLGTFLASAILPGGRRRLYDPAVSEGKILICVTNPHANSSEDLARRLREIGGGEPKETDL